MSTQKFLGLLFFSCVLGACTIRIGPLDENTAPPEEGSGADPPLALDAAHQKTRQEEADRYIAEVVYQGATVLYSIMLPSGDQLDFIDRNTLPSLPYSLPALPFGAGDLALPPGVAFGLTELEQSAELLALAAMATPFHRPTFLPYVMGEALDAASIEDYLQRYQVGGAPSGTHQLYAGLVSDKPNRGISGYMSQFRPEVAPDSLSLMEFAVACPADGPAQEMVGIAISVDRVNGFGPRNQALPDTRPRMHIEYARPQNGPNGYVWDGMDGTFVANPLRLHQPGEVVPYSVINEVSIEHLMAVFQSPTGDWWIAYNGDLLGYYPASLFTLLKKGACKATWYTEVYNPTPTFPNPTEMGSGLFAEAGLFKAAHIRNPLFYDPTWLAVKPEDKWFSIPVEPKCYNRSALIHLGPPWDSSFLFLGGPGSNNPECIWP